MTAFQSVPDISHARQSCETSFLSLSSSHHVDCLKPDCEMAEAAASLSSLSAFVSCDLKRPSAGRSLLTITR
eukprot:4351334-Prymnesium_polylepis.1